MKVILKIDEYLEEKNSVVFKTCRLHSHKSIDEFGAKVVNCDDLNTVSYTHLTLPTNLSV